MADDSLDHPAALAAADPGGMLSLAGRLGSQLRGGFEAGRRAAGLPSGEGIRAVGLCGMGGSGVGGDILRSLFAERLPVPVVVSKGYAVPEFFGKDTLVVASSFSGNTEETLAAYAEAVSRGCRVVTVSAGGDLAERSRIDGVAHVRLPDNVPVPRAALGYLSAAPVGILEGVGLIPPMSHEVEQAAALLDDLAGRLGPERPSAENEAKSLAVWLAGRTPVIWGSEGLAEAPAVRWKTQVNENAKAPAFASVLPELDHNEIEGWSEGSGRDYGLVILRHPLEHPRIQPRVVATLGAVAVSGLEGREVWAAGAASLEILFSLIMKGDFASTYLAILRGVDPTPIPVLTGLKQRLRD